MPDNQQSQEPGSFNARIREAAAEVDTWPDWKLDSRTLGYRNERRQRGEILPKPTTLELAQRENADLRTKLEASEARIKELSDSNLALAASQQHWVARGGRAEAALIREQHVRETAERESHQHAERTADLYIERESLQAALKQAQEQNKGLSLRIQQMQADDESAHKLCCELAIKIGKEHELAEQAEADRDRAQEELAFLRADIRTAILESPDDAGNQYWIKLLSEALDAARAKDGTPK